LQGLAIEDDGIFYIHLEEFTAILYIIWPFVFSNYLFGIFLPVLVCCRKKNLATLATL
jgi:hypothetical protein